MIISANILGIDEGGWIVKDYGKIGNCNDAHCKYFDESMELNCSYSEDNSKCIKTIEPISSHAVLDEVAEMLQDFITYGMISYVENVWCGKYKHKELVQKANEWLWNYNSNKS